MLPERWCDLPKDWRTRKNWDGWHKSRAKAIGCVYDKERADGVVAFMQSHRLVKGRWGGEPVTLLPHFEHQAVRPFYGYIDPETGLRRFTRCDMWTAKKNAKTTNGSLVASEALFWEGEQGAEVYSCAGDREQSGLIYQNFAPMVENNGYLSPISKRLDTHKRIVYPRNNAFYVATSSEASTKAGYQPSCVLFDEIAFQPNRALWDMMTQGAFASRREPQLWVMSTAGYDRNGVGYEEYTYARQVRDGVIDDPRLLPVIWEVPEDADWTDENNWALANPALGYVFDIESLRDEFRKAVERPVNENSFRMLRLNQWVSQETRFIPMQAWDEASRLPVAKRGDVWFGGLDLSSTTDITAWCEIHMDEDGHAHAYWHFWLPGDGIEERERRDHAPYREWARAGFFTLTEGNIVDYRSIIAHIEERSRESMPREIAYDPWSARQICEVELPALGYNTVPMRQGFASLSEPTKKLLELVVSQKLHHGANPVARWMADNVKAVTDPAGNVKLDKAKSTGRIDGMAALVNAVARATLHAQPVESVYESRGLLML